MPPRSVAHCPHCGRGPYEVHRGLPGHIRQSPACHRKDLESLLQPDSSSPNPSSPVSGSPRASSPSPLPDDSGSVHPLDGHDFLPTDVPSDDDVPGAQRAPVNASGPWSYRPRNPAREPAVGPRVQTAWEKRKANEDPEHPYFPWVSLHEFQTVNWLTTEGLSQGAIDRFLELQKKAGIIYSFSSAKEMFLRIKENMDTGPKWKVIDVKIPEAGDLTVPLYYRDIRECAIHLFGKPDFAEHLDYAPDEIFDNSGNRVYHEISSGEIWNELQADGRIPPGTTVITIMIASDKTHLTIQSGDQNMHPVYISIGNLHKDIRNKPSRQGWMLLAKLPTHKFAELKARLGAKKAEKDAMPGVLSKRLFHRCMSIVFAPLKKMEVIKAVDAEGNERNVMPVLVAWLADMEEQWMILGLAKYSCPKCVARYSDLDSPHPKERRTGDSILRDLKAIRAEYPQADVWQFVNRAVEEGYVGVEELCWEGLPVDMCRVVCVDALHGLHKMFGDHIMKWVGNAVGENELDLRFIAQPRRVGFRNFSSGISHLSQLSGREHRDLERHLLPVIAGAEDSDLLPLDPRVARCTAAILDFISTALIPLHTEETLRSLESHLRIFWQNLRVFIDIKARVNESGDVIDHFRIPKLHNLFHFIENTRDLGAPDNYSTEICESLHIPNCKDAYKATNRRNYNQQIIDYLIRMDSLAESVAYWRWRYPDSANQESAVLAEGADDEDDPDLDGPQEEMPGASEKDHFTMAKRPHIVSKSIDSIMLSFEIPDLHSAISLYHLDHLSGARPHRDDYPRDQLPPQFERLNVWTHIRHHYPRLNDFYPSGHRLLRCKPSSPDTRVLFDPIVVELPPARAHGSVERRIADLRLIFRPSSDADAPILAYVHWYKPTSTPRAGHKLREVEKMMRGNQRAGGIILLSQIKGACPLASKIDGSCPPNLDQNNALSELSSFFINPFVSHVDYETFR